MGVKGESGFRPTSMAFAARSHRNFQRTVIINASSALACGPALSGSRRCPVLLAAEPFEDRCGFLRRALRITAPRPAQLNPVVASSCGLMVPANARFLTRRRLALRN